MGSRSSRGDSFRAVFVDDANVAVKSIVIGERVGSGGQADLFEVDDRPDLLAKIFHREPRTDLLSIVTRLQLAEKNLGNELTAGLPVALLLGKGTSDYAGVLIRRIFAGREHLTLTDYYRSRATAPASAAELLVLAKRVAADAERFHSLGFTLVDVSPGNILVRTDAAVVEIGWVDLDSANHGEVSGSTAGGTPGFISAEVKKTGSTQSSDRFSLGVIILTLLLRGVSPFACPRRPELGGSQPEEDDQDRIESGLCWLTHPERHDLEKVGLGGIAPLTEWAIPLQNQARQLLEEAENRPTMASWKGVLNQVGPGDITWIHQPPSARRTGGAEDGPRTPTTSMSAATSSKQAAESAKPAAISPKSAYVTSTSERKPATLSVNAKSAASTKARPKRKRVGTMPVVIAALVIAVIAILLDQSGLMPSWTNSQPAAELTQPPLESQSEPIEAGDCYSLYEEYLYQQRLAADASSYAVLCDADNARTRITAVVAQDSPEAGECSKTSYCHWFAQDQGSNRVLFNVIPRVGDCFWGSGKSLDERIMGYSRLGVCGGEAPAWVKQDSEVAEIAEELQIDVSEVKHFEFTIEALRAEGADCDEGQLSWTQEYAAGVLTRVCATSLA